MRPNCSQKRTEKDSNCVFLQLFNFFVCVLWVYPSIRHRSLPKMLHLERKSFIHRSSSLQRSYLSLVCVFLTFNNAKFLWIFPACSFSLCHQLINFYNLSGSPRSFVPVFFIMCWMWMVDIVILNFTNLTYYLAYDLNSFLCVPSKSIGSPLSQHLLFSYQSKDTFTHYESETHLSHVIETVCIFSHVFLNLF